MSGPLQLEWHQIDSEALSLLMGMLRNFPSHAMIEANKSANG